MINKRQSVGMQMSNGWQLNLPYLFTSLLLVFTLVAGAREVTQPPKDDVYHPAVKGTYTVPPELKDFRLLRSEPLKITNAKEFGYDLARWQSDPSRIIFHEEKYHCWVIDCENRLIASRNYRGPRENGKSRILYITSKDGRQWKAVDYVPLGPKGSAYDLDLEQANVLYHDGRFYLFSEAYTSNIEKYAQLQAGIVCLVADKPEGPWKQVGDLLLRPERDGTSFDTDAVGNPRPVFLNGKWFMYYKGYTKGQPTKNGVAIADSLTGPYKKYEGNPLLYGHGHFAWRYKHGIIMLMFDAFWEQNRTRLLWTEDGIHFVPLAEEEGSFLFGAIYCPYDPTFGKPVTEHPTTRYWGIHSQCYREKRNWDLERFEWEFGEPEPLPAGVADVSRSPYVTLRSVPMGHVEWTEGFWADRFELCRTSMLPTLHDTLLDPKCSAQLNRLKFAAGLIDKDPGGVDWADGDCYKWIETMAHVYSVRPDAKLDALMDEWIAVIAKAQDEDGYISTNRGRDKAARLQMPYHHEMYNFGHLLTAACVHHRATGKTNFLAVARKLADFLDRIYQANPPRLVHFPWNPSVYMGLVEMYRTTGDRRYLATVETMINNRGSDPGGHYRNGGTDQTQDRMPLRRETEAVGHAVCGMYLYCGAADLYAETGEAELLRALERIWDSVALRKMDITGSVAMGGGRSRRGDPVHEAFGPDYAQPNEYNETCANIGNGMFSYRMLLLSGDAKYADLMERVAYNGLNAAVDLQGQKWFYCNPLKWQGQPGGGHLTGLRWRTNDCYCCPPSVARTTAKLHNWAYSLSDNGVWVNLYGGNTLATTLPGGTPVKLVQQTDYPWDGKVAFNVKQAGKEAFAIHLRIPGWADDAALKVNGKPHPGALQPGTYAKIHRAWASGDVIELSLPMPVRLMEAHPKVKKLRNTVAVMRGPLVYCLELPKNEGGEEVWRDGVFLPENIELTPEHREDLLGGVTVLTGNALTFKGRDAFCAATPAAPAKPARPADPRLYRPFKPRRLARPTDGLVEVTLIPYYAWANRGLSMMQVWIPLAR